MSNTLSQRTVDTEQAIKSNKGTIMSKAVFYHAGCEVCVAAEHLVAHAIDKNKYELEIVHFANASDRIDEAEAAGVKSVPALVLDGQTFHINFGASMADVKGLVLA